MALDIHDPQLAELIATVGLASTLIANDATTEQWGALTATIVETFTPDQIANMLTGACAIIARITPTERSTP